MSAIAPVLGQLPSGLFILTARRGEMETGMLASWVMQAGFEPPMVTLCVQLGRYVCDWLSAGEPFVLNVLSKENKTLLAHFARGFEPGQPAFSGLEIQRSGEGVPVLTGTLGHLECRSRQHLDSADHRIFLADVIAGELHAAVKPWVHLRKSGLHY